eukprot:TRINITY_DN1483_c0_g1_i2.p2 TRINITY_DN1483_c0_g1~~TRINITY_DN1483_c0_g1_i2.p2  ORF type:complete len:210 (+),score=56.40 TRINITY_DN1483_c0_g1_i2:50-679(+)
MECNTVIFFFQAEDGIRDAQESRGLGDVYKRQVYGLWIILGSAIFLSWIMYLMRYASWYPRYVNWMHSKHITALEPPLDEDRKIGDDLIVDNLKDVTYRLMSNLERELEARLEAMDEKVSKFYEMLLKEEKGEEERAPNTFKLSDELQTPINKEEIEIRLSDKKSSSNQEENLLNGHSDDEDHKGEQEYDDEPAPQKLIEMKRMKKNGE